MSLTLVNELSEIGLRAGVIVARGCQIQDSPESFQSLLKDLIEQRSQQEFPEPALKKAVRDLLRQGGFKPAGRNKPASEYLAQAARKQRFPIINNGVDINNYLSLKTGLPISLLNLDAFQGGLRLRHGREDESYVFNQSGQEISLRGLIVCAAMDTDTALGNPVKDSMTGKINDHSQNLMAVIYSPKDFVSEDSLRATSQEFADWLKKIGGAEAPEVILC